MIVTIYEALLKELLMLTVVQRCFIVTCNVTAINVGNVIAV